MNDVIGYGIGELELFDYAAVMSITGENKTKLQRIMKMMNIEPVTFKNRHLFTLNSIHLAMEIILLKRLKNVII
jgi:hypothetical protein